MSAAMAKTTSARISRPKSQPNPIPKTIPWPMSFQVIVHTLHVVWTMRAVHMLHVRVSDRVGTPFRHTFAVQGRCWGSISTGERVAGRNGFDHLLPGKVDYGNGAVLGIGNEDMASAGPERHAMPTVIVLATSVYRNELCEFGSSGSQV